MENATKALLIAAAILVAILIISLGLAVYNKAANATDSADLSQAQVQAYNEKFLKYEGTSKRGSEVNALLTTVLNNNMSEMAENSSDSAKIIKLTGNASVEVDASAGTMKKVDTGKVYDITVKRNSKTGLVNEIEIKKHE